MMREGLPVAELGEIKHDYDAVTTYGCESLPTSPTDMQYAESMRS